MLWHTVHWQMGTVGCPVWLDNVETSLCERMHNNRRHFCTLWTKSPATYLCQRSPAKQFWAKSLGHCIQELCWMMSKRAMHKSNCEHIKVEQFHNIFLQIKEKKTISTHLENRTTLAEACTLSLRDADLHLPFFPVPFPSMLLISDSSHNSGSFSALPAELLLSWVNLTDVVIKLSAGKPKLLSL